MMKAIRDAREIPVQEKPLEYSWTTAAGMKHSSLAHHLCELGRESKGEACKACVAQCAFGRHYLGIKDPEYKFQKMQRQAKRMVQAYEKDGTVIGEWESVKEAAENLGIRHKTKISNSITNGVPHHGMYWRWVEAEG
jgi:hypothetical protein